MHSLPFDIDVRHHAYLIFAILQWPDKVLLFIIIQINVSIYILKFNTCRDRRDMWSFKVQASDTWVFVAIFWTFLR